MFDRQYVHKQSQSSRITDLLALLNLSDRYNTIHIDNTTILFLSVVVWDNLCNSKSIESSLVSASPVKAFQSTCNISFWDNKSFACRFTSAYFPPAKPPGNLNKWELYSPNSYCIFY